MRRTTFILPSLLAVACIVAQSRAEEDPYLWLEEVEGTRALDWVRQQNAATFEVLESDGRFAEFKRIAETIVQDKRRIPLPAIRGEFVYNFWRDEEHVRGVWRRAKLADYLKDDVPWEVLLDVDRLAEVENENWVYKGSVPLPPEFARCMIGLSRGGTDAMVWREFDVDAKAFVDDGFSLPEAKSRVDWFDRDTLVVGTDFGEGSLTRSGYPRLMKKWRRGRPLERAETLFAGETADVGVWFRKDLASPHGTSLVARDVTFYTAEYRLAASEGPLVRVPVPPGAEFRGFFHGRLLFLLRDDWTPSEQAGQPIPRGSLVALPADDILAGNRRGSIDVLWRPTERTSIGQVAPCADSIVLTILDNVKSRAVRLTPVERAGQRKWKTEPIDVPTGGTVRVASHSEFSDKLFLSFESFLVPRRLYYADGGGRPAVVKTLEPKFDADGLACEQHEAVSRDGTRIPYFVIGPKEMKLDGANPTILYGYGGFEIAMLPRYMAVQGRLWLERGGVYVVANIRGGGEFGPKWHQAALKENRQRAFDDFQAVARDLIDRKITAPARLGIAGGSNGGLLVGVSFTQRPELFGAVVCQVPLLDMLRYTKLLAGPSWMAEYGDPDDPKMRSVLRGYSPYHNVDPDNKYPEVFFLTSTRDDRVHPGHARKMVARMTELGHRVYYFENVEGGHGAAANLLQRARRYALEYTYLHRQLFPPMF